MTHIIKNMFFFTHLFEQITIEDVNDNAPVFTRKVFESSSPIREDTKIGQSVYKLSARDKDSGSNGLITYKLDDGLPEDFPFELNPLTGVFTVSKGLDFESKKSYR